MNFYIPELGTKLVLTADWTFPLYFEERNKSLGKMLGIVPPDEGSSEPMSREYFVFHRWDPWNQPNLSTPVTLPADTKLTVDRIYVRKGASEFSSLSFIVGKPGFKQVRFWAKLADVHQMEFDLLNG